MQLRSKYAVTQQFRIYAVITHLRRNYAIDAANTQQLPSYAITQQLPSYAVTQQIRIYAAITHYAANKQLRIYAAITQFTQFTQQLRRNYAFTQ